MKRTMLDIESLGTVPGSIVLSIGAVVFDESGRIYDEFYANIDKTTSIAAGLRLDPVTSTWWRSQPKEAQEAVQVNLQPLAKVLDAFRIWFFKQDAPTLWSQGAGFDAPILEGAFDAAGIAPPWKYWNVRDTRTVYDLFDFDTREIRMTGTAHNALDDARHQVKLMAAALRKGRMPTASPRDGVAGEDKHLDLGGIFE